MHSLWMLVAGLMFAFMNVCIKYAAPYFSAAELVFYRSLFQLGVTWLVLVRLGLPVRTTRFGMHVHRGVAGFLAVFTFFYSITRLPMGTATTLNYTSPLFLALLLAWIARERPGRMLQVSLGLGFLGTILLLRPTLTPEQFWPAAVCLLSGAISAVAVWNVRELVRAEEPEARVVFYLSLSCMLGALLWMIPQPWHPIHAENLPALFGVAVFGSAGQLALTRAYGKGRTLVTAALSYGSIVFTTVLGIALFGDVVPLLAWIGIALIIVAGIISFQSQPAARETPPPQVTND